MSETDMQAFELMNEQAAEMDRLNGIISDQATTINGLKRALAASQADLETLMKTTRILHSMESESKRRKELCGG